MPRPSRRAHFAVCRAQRNRHSPFRATAPGSGDPAYNGAHVQPTPGSRIGPYEIVSSLGAGGMGEVYRARDSKLDRYVAIKILPPLVASDPERRARFEREARALATLNHPNIAHIYGTEEAAGSMAIVMELVEGEDLVARIARGRLEWRDAQPIARQLAEALDAAHERGIVHRDLKPANIRITPDEMVKVLDFGLAKAVAAGDTLQQDPGLSPTFTSAGTQLGTIVGTAAYMAPEQAKGKAVDKRADIWAFGCVLYEMLAGRSPFAADTAAESLGMVMMKEPDWAALPSTVPPRIVALLQRCIVKDPRRRLRDIGEAAHVLAQAESALAAPGVPQRLASWRAVYIVAAIGLLLAGAAATLAWSLKPDRPLPLRRLELPADLATEAQLAISPDGMRLAYFSAGRVFVRELAEATPRDIGDAPPTAERIFWSPDSRAIGFSALATIRTIPVSGGAAFTVCRIPGAGRLMGALWRPDGMIVFSAWRDSLYAVAATGGQPVKLLESNPQTDVDFHEVTLAPGGRLLVAVHGRKDDGVRTEIVDGGQRRTFVNDTATRDVRYVEPGHLLFRRIGDNQGLWALPWTDAPPDLSRAVLLEAGATNYSVSTEGTLVVRSAATPMSTLAWMDRRGKSTITTSIPGAAIADLRPAFAVSLTGDRVVLAAGARPQSNIFVRDLATGIDTRLTTENVGAQAAIGGTDQVLLYPSWFPRGDRVLYAAGGVEATDLVMHRADGAGEPAVLTKGMLGRVSADGKWFVWLEDDRGQGRIRFASIDDDGRIGSPIRSFAALEKMDIRAIDLSPDNNRLLAFSVRDPAGPANIHLVDFPDGRTKWQATTDGGTSPRFSRDGRELFFLSGGRNAQGAREGRLMVMTIESGPAVKLGTPSVVLSGDAMPIGFDTAHDGRLLISRTVESSRRTTATLVQNWPALLQRPQ